ncbi:unnamed protein product [Sphagnum balticum]
MHAAAGARHMRADVGRGRQGLQCVVVVGTGGFAAEQWKVVAVGRVSWVQPGSRRLQKDPPSWLCSHGAKTRTKRTDAFSA